MPTFAQALREMEQKQPARPSQPRSEPEPEPPDRLPPIALRTPPLLVYVDVYEVRATVVFRTRVNDEKDASLWLRKLRSAVLKAAAYAQRTFDVEIEAEWGSPRKVGRERRPAD